MSVEVATDMALGELEYETCTGRRCSDLEGCVEAVVADVDILQERIVETCSAVMVRTLETRAVFSPVRRARDDVCIFSVRSNALTKLCVDLVE